MGSRSWKSIVALGALTFSLLSSAAQADTVTSPAGVLTAPPVGTVSDPVVLDAWFRTNVRNGGSIGITSDYPRSGNGSVYMQGTQGPGGNSSKGDIEYFYSDAFGGGRTLGALTSLGYDWYRDSSSTNNAAQHPSLRLYVDADGSFATNTDRGYLIYEQVYNGVATAATNAWQTATITDSTNLWWRQFVPGATDEMYDRNLAEWKSGQSSAGFVQLSSNSVVYGLSSGFGSGWGPFEGAVDNITIGFNGVATTYNFEVAAVPLPAAALAGVVLMGGIGIGRKRRASADA